MRNLRFILGVSLLTSLASLPVYAKTTAPAAPAAAFGSFVYVGGQVGWAHSDWSGFTGLAADNSGVVFGGKAGYQATRRFGAEVGGFVLPKSDQSIPEDWLIGGPTGSIKSWVGYAAATFRFPLFSERLYLRGKIGPAYRSLEHTGELFDGVGTGHYWTAILGASLNYAFGSAEHPLIAGVEYSNVFGSSDSWTSDGTVNADAAPSVQIVTATLSMAFRV